MSDLATLERVCREIPKTDLHLHLDGSVRPSTVVELAAKADPPRTLDLATAQKKMRVGPESRSLPEYLTKFPFVNGFLQKPDALQRVARELVEDCAAENVRIVEIRFCPNLHTILGAPLNEILEAVLAGFHAGATATGVRGGIIVDCLREQPEDKHRELAELAVRYKDKGVVALDLAGNEADHDAKNALTAFQIAGLAGLRRIAHAGEASGPESIRQAIDVLQAERIGHGTRLVGDAALTAEITERGIPLEVCITSNVQTRAVSEPAVHPFARYLRGGVRVTINTDNRTVSGTNSSRELALAWYYGGLSRDELRKVVLNGVEASFVPSDDKAKLREEFAATFDAVMAKVPASISSKS